MSTPAQSTPVQANPVVHPIPRHPHHLPSVPEAFAMLLSLVVIALFVNTFVLQPFLIPSESMERTLLVGDFLLVNKQMYAPAGRFSRLLMPYRDVERGDIIIFHHTQPHPYLVKRVVGIPGDRLHLRNGVLYRNGVAQNEPYAAMPVDDGNPQHTYQPYRDDFPSIPTSMGSDITETWALDLPSHIEGDDLVVPPGKVFAMGDNRLDSLDGRYWGFVPRENIVGRPLFVYWSFETPEDQMNKTSMSDRIGFMFHIAIHFFDGTRWKRTLHLIK